ncbi:MAG TPA: hypothetical protein VGD55_12090 [Acidothermaceae bacterium]
MEIPWNFWCVSYWSNEMSNAIFGFLSNMTVLTHDDFPRRRTAAFETVSDP